MLLNNRDGNIYTTVEIGNQCWMGENLAYLPSDAEWYELSNYLSPFGPVGGALKEAGTAHWNDPNVGATNSSGFTALPGVYRFSTGNYYSIVYSGYLWTATEFIPEYGIYVSLFFDKNEVLRSYLPNDQGFSVRCLRD